MKKIYKSSFVLCAFFFLTSNAFAEEKCENIFSAEAVYGNKTISLCREGDNITYEFKNQDDKDLIIKVTKNRKEVFIHEVGRRERIFINDGINWYGIDPSEKTPTIWGYEGKELNFERRRIVDLSLYHSISLKPTTVKYNPSLIKDLKPFEQ